MKQIPLKAIERQSLSVMLEGVLYDIEVKECSGVMAIAIRRGEETILDFRRVCAGIPLIPRGSSDVGNFIFTSFGDELPYFNKFESTDQLYYVTLEEIGTLDPDKLIELPTPLSKPLVKIDGLTDTSLPNYVTLTQPGNTTYVANGLRKDATPNVPRFEDTGLLLESQATRYTFAIGYANAVSEGQIGPEGTTVSAHRINPKPGQYSYARGTCPTLRGSYLISFYAKRADGNTGVPAIKAGTYGALNPCSSYYLGNGWWKMYGIIPNPTGNTGVGWQPGSEPSYSVYVSDICVEQLVNVGRPTSFIEGGSTITRVRDELSYSRDDAEWVYIKYLERGIVKKLLYPYAGELVTPRNINLQELLVWNREPTDAEKKLLGV